MDRKPITVETIVNAPMDKVWKYWNKPEHIVNWAFAQDDWEALSPENDLQVGGKFKTTMSAKDKSQSFDFTGEYTQVREHEIIGYTMDDGRKVSVQFESIDGNQTRIIETFDPENENSEELQRSGWQAILDNFKKYTEGN